MEEHFPNHRWFHANPEERIRNRKINEKWLYEKFLFAGGEPKTNYPCYFTLGKSLFLKNFESFDGKSAEVKIPLDLFSSKNISFTYPDSFFSKWLSENKDHELYNSELNGKIFMLDEILNLLSQNKIPKNVYMDTPNYKYHFYIESQVWDYDILEQYKK
ncbi:MAG: hypothetical protein GY754_07525 [bacterium]|nr:hypothetical protein [bacterium]